jgi:hypothetical protein
MSKAAKNRGEYLIPLVHRGDSASSKDNVLWNQDNVYVMDNHRLALWCWFQKMQEGQRYNLLHIDAHPDMSESAILALKNHDYDLWAINLNDYRKAWQNSINMPVFRWDNYIEVFLQKYPDQVGKTFSATHHLGSRKELSEEVRVYDLAKFMNGLFSGNRFENDLPWIVNLDLDYFFSAAPEKFELFAEEFVQSLSSSIKMGLDNGMIQILTISLSPECCGSWEKAELMLSKFGYSL